MCGLKLKVIKSFPFKCLAARLTWLYMLAICLTTLANKEGQCLVWVDVYQPCSSIQNRCFTYNTIGV